MTVENVDIKDPNLIKSIKILYNEASNFYIDNYNDICDINNNYEIWKKFYLILQNHCVQGNQSIILNGNVLVNSDSITLEIYTQDVLIDINKVIKLKLLIDKSSIREYKLGKIFK